MPYEDELDIHVERAPGMRVLSTQMSGEPFGPGTWVELDRFGAIRVLPKPPVETHWIRAASVTASAKSDYTIPVDVIVKKCPCVGQVKTRSGSGVVDPRGL